MQSGSDSELDPVQALHNHLLPACKGQDLHRVIDLTYRWMCNYFDPTESGFYEARSVEAMLADRKLTGCQDWGGLWMHVLQLMGVRCEYVQGVDRHWLDEKVQEPADSPWTGWTGHVFILAEHDRQRVLFCSTSAEPARVTGKVSGREQIDDRYVVLFRGIGPHAFHACDGKGMRILLHELLLGWARPVDTKQVTGHLAC
jgi:hypothetical protein